jgi:hypothetical protein
VCNGDPKSFDWEGPLDMVYHVVWSNSAKQLVPDPAFGTGGNGLVLNWTINFNNDIHTSCWVANAGDLRSIILEFLTNYQNLVIQDIYQVVAKPRRSKLSSFHSRRCPTGP